jgi:hypothetical protein
MPQEKGLLWGYNDMFNYCEYFGWKDIQLDVMLSESSCLEFIAKFEATLKAEEEEQNLIKKFQKENKIRYIAVDLEKL